MHKNYRIITLFISLFFIQGCTNTLYLGETEELDSDDQQRKMLLYWVKTEPLLGNTDAGPATLLTECSSRQLSFVENGSGLYFFGTPGLDKLANHPHITTPNILCGRIVQHMRFKTIEAGPLNVEIRCTAVKEGSSENSMLSSPAYLKARKQAYTFVITETSSWSLFGEEAELPAQPECRN